jgi:hypothetical protein
MRSRPSLSRWLGALLLLSVSVQRRWALPDPPEQAHVGEALEAAEADRPCVRVLPAAFPFPPQSASSVSPPSSPPPSVLVLVEEAANDEHHATEAAKKATARKLLGRAKKAEHQEITTFVNPMSGLFPANFVPSNAPALARAQLEEQKKEHLAALRATPNGLRRCGHAGDT